MLADGNYAYYADETSAWYLVTASDVRELGEAMMRGDEDEDAYSVWCTGYGEEVGDTDHDRLDQIADETTLEVVYRCQCGEALGQRCEWTGDRKELIHVRWVPDSDRGSAQASGTYDMGAYAQSLYVTAGCAEVLRYEYADGEPTDREDPYVRVCGPAYE